MAQQFKNKLVVVAGGTGGLGREVSLAFLNEYAHVAVTFRSEKEFGALKDLAGPDAARLEGHQVDVTSEIAVKDLVAKIVSQHGGIDALVNAVGTYAGGKTLWETEPAVFNRMIELNLLSGYVLSRAIVPVMLERRSGAIINVASRAAFDHSAGAAAYAASKAAAVAMIDSLAADLQGTGVRANSVLPGIIDTEANRKAMPNADYAKWPKPEEIARVILFLCSDDAKLINGAAVPVYGDA
jgi:NAD(P)-dependent dehydrogenase (short-subunit alcohol dehydrogenase family)